jgi:hypothetical protein
MILVFGSGNANLFLNVTRLPARDETVLYQPIPSGGA